MKQSGRDVPPPALRRGRRPRPGRIAGPSPGPRRRPRRRRRRPVRSSADRRTGGDARRRPWPPRSKLKPAPFEPNDLRFPINLATALRLSDARPLIVAAAQARVWVAEAELTQAKVLWIPDLNIGFDYLRHDGGGPDFNKGIMTAPS